MIRLMLKIVFISLLGCIIYLSLYPRQPVDDAYISFRYAHNLSQGKGLCFNEGERVEGFTNLLWVLILSGLSWFYPDIPTLSTALALLLTLMTMFLLMQLIEDHGLSFFWQVLGIILLVHAAPFLYWGTNGLETAIFTFLVLIGYRCWLNSKHFYPWIWIAVIFWATFLTRPEGSLVFVLLTIVEMSCFFRSGKKDRERFKHVLIAGLIFSVLVFLVVIWRYSYFESFQPNTYYAKVSGCHTVGRGLERLSGFLIYGGGLVYLLFSTILIWFGVTRRRSQFLNAGIIHGFVLCAGYIVFLVYSGGDIYFLYRSYVPLIPFFTLFMVLSINYSLTSLWKANGSGWQKIGTFVFISFIMLIMCFILIRTYFQGPEYEARLISETADQHRVLIGNWMKQSLPQDSTLALNAIGIVPYLCQFETYDMIGLTDRHIARQDMSGKHEGAFGHCKYDGYYILERKPDYIIMSNSVLLKLTDQWGHTFGRPTLLPIDTIVPLFQKDFIYLPGDAEIFQSPYFRENYECWAVPLGPGNLVLFKNKAHFDLFSTQAEKDYEESDM